jgi:hypothetical protein
VGDQVQRATRTGAGRGGRTVSGVPADVTLEPDVKAFAGAIGGGGFGARRPRTGGSSVRGSAGPGTGAGDFSGFSGFNFGPF